MQVFCHRVVHAHFFNPLIIALILINGIVIGAETSESLNNNYNHLFQIINRLILGVFILEAVLKIGAVWPKPSRYFKDGWNLFDFTIVILSLVPATGELAMVARLLRLLRVVRLISAIPELRLIVSTLIRSIPSMGHVIILMSIIFYIYGVMGYHLFHEHDPVHWRTLGLGLLTLFRIVTLEDWTDVMYTAMELHPLAWVYFVSFVVLGTFVVINLFIAVVLNNLDEAKHEALREIQPTVSKSDLVNQLQDTQAALTRLQARLHEVDIQLKQ